MRLIPTVTIKCIRGDPKSYQRAERMITVETLIARQA
jgi:hypothetical protein